MWINKETTDIVKTEVFKEFIKLNQLEYGITESSGDEIVYCHNKLVLFQIYIERGFLEIDLFAINENKWIRWPVDYYIPPNITHRDYYNKVTKNINQVEVFNLDVTKYLHYYLKFISEYLKEVFLGDFSKINSSMELMKDLQINEITQIIKNST